jgi:seryl-tRNA synthetase
MHDIKAIRDNPEAFDRGLARRGLSPLSARILEIDARRRQHIVIVEKLREQSNTYSNAIATAVQSNDKARIGELKILSAKVKHDIKEIGDKQRSDETKIEAELKELLSNIPNLPLDDVPDGADETGNIEVRRHGEKPRSNFEPRQHFDIGEWLGLMDFEAAAKISGARFVVLRGQLARLERALAQFMLDLQTGSNGYTEHFVPFMVNDAAMYGTGQLPKFAEDLFKTTDGRWLIPTAEVSLTNLVRERIVEEKDLPLRFTAYTPCFRAEAGAAGRDTRGMIRQHQFSKVELVSITTPEQSREELERMTGCAESVLQKLGLHYRVMRLCAGDMGFGSRMTYDIEVWLPGQNAFREISSCSVCGDFQARRMDARYKPADGKGTRFVHTLNGSGLAVGRTMVAILENYQNADGSVTIPEALRPYMGGADKITRP